MSHAFIPVSVDFVRVDFARVDFFLADFFFFDFILVDFIPISARLAGIVSKFPCSSKLFLKISCRVNDTVQPHSVLGRQIKE